MPSYAIVHNIWAGRPGTILFEFRCKNHMAFSIDHSLNEVLSFQLHNAHKPHVERFSGSANSKIPGSKSREYLGIMELFHLFRTRSL